MINLVGFDGAVEAGVAAFCAGQESPSNNEVLERLTGSGVEPWLAERLLIFLPMAYTRRLLPEVEYSDVLSSPSGQVDLRDEPVFAAALARAEQAGREEFQRIATRSAEFNAINNALNAGEQMSDLALAESALVEDLRPAQPGDGGVPSPRACFHALLQGHNVELPDGAQVDARMYVHPAPEGTVMAQLDFAVAHPALATPWLVESLAGHGRTWHDAITGALHKFQGGSLHPIVEGLLRPGACPDQVEREPYDHPTGKFDLVLGAQLNLFTNVPVPPMGPLLDRLLDALRAEPLPRKVHALRVFTAHQNGQLHTNEVLLNSQPWPAGEAVVATSPAPIPEGMVGTRVFGLLVPTDA